MNTVKCDLIPYDSSDASILVMMYRTGHRKAWMKVCEECKAYHVIREDDDDGE